MLALPAILHGTGEVAYFIVGIKIFVYGVFAFTIAHALKPTSLDLIRVIRLCAAVCIAFFSACAAFDSMREIALSIKGETYGIESLLEAYRLWFPTSGHTFHLGVFFLILLFTQIALREKIGWTIPTLLCCAIASRSSLIFGAIALLLAYAHRHPIQFAAIAISIVSILITLWPVLAEYNEVRYILEPFIKALDNDGFSSGSTDRLLSNHIYLPETQEILIGTGKYFNPDGTFYGGTDSGYLRPMLYGGIILTLLQASFLIVICLKTFKINAFGVFATITMLVLNVKAEVFSGGIQMAALLFFYFASNWNPNENPNNFPAKGFFASK
jgi:hypothetical protein